MKYYSVLAIALLISACSNQQIYNNVRHNNEIECSKLPQSQHEDCMAEIDQPYDKYERDLEETKK